jgi:hypothetical protein
MSVFFGLTPAAGPGVVVARIARAVDHCVTGFEWHDETFGRLNREHHGSRTDDIAKSMR